MKLATTFLMLLLNMLAMHNAYADSLRCGTELIDVGATVYDLLNACGEPGEKDGNRWFYDQSEGELTMIVTVGDGVIKSIHTEVSERP